MFGNAFQHGVLRRQKHAEMSICEAVDLLTRSINTQDFWPQREFGLIRALSSTGRLVVLVAEHRTLLGDA